jgi:hypothetical protein
MNSKSNLSDAEFVKVYLGCKNNDELAVATGLKNPQTRAAKMRKAGVMLPAYGRAKKTINVVELNKLIEQSTKK